MQGAQILRNEAYIKVRRNDEGCSATQQMRFLRSRHYNNFERGTIRTLSCNSGNFSLIARRVWG